MGGERLVEAPLGSLGIEGDRGIHVRNVRGRVVTARTHPALLRHHVTLGAIGEPIIDGYPWQDAHVTSMVQADAGDGASLARSTAEQRFDILPLLVATDGAIAAFGYDGRRLRPNLIIGGVEGLTERSWEGRALRIGNAVVSLADLRGRCVMTTFDPDTLAQDSRVLKSIVRRFHGTLALNASVQVGGTIYEGDEVTLAPLVPQPT
jgi:uncharacterized protein YcbX